MAPRILHTLAWASAGRLVAQAITWVSTIWVMRLLGPSDYGLMALAMLAIAAFQLFEEGGLGTMLVRAPTLDDLLIQKVFGLVLVLGAALSMLLLIAAPLLARILGNEAVTPVLRWLAVLLILGAAIVIPRSLLERRLAFQRIAAVEITAAVLASGTTLVLALNGAGIWALVGGTLVLSAARAVGLNLACPAAGWPRFSVQGMSEALRFGGAVTIERVFWYLYSQADVFIAGRLLGSQATGLYVVGKQLAELPAEKLAPGLQQAVLPTLARLQEQPAQLGEGLRQGIMIMSLVSFPIFFGLAAVAGDLVPLVLGARWDGATLPLSAYAATLPLGLVSGVLLSALKAVGRADISVISVALGAAIMVIAFMVGVQWGVSGLALSWVAGYPIYFGLTVLRSARALGTTPATIWRQLMGPLLASIVMLVIVVGFRHWAEPLLGPMVRLTTAIFVGIGAYAILALLALRPAVREAAIIFVDQWKPA